MSVQHSASRELWFLDTRVTIRLSSTEGADGLSVLEHQAPPGDSPPLHVHRSEDETFYVLDGELLLKIGETQMAARPGDTLRAPKGVPHTYRVESAAGARWLTIMVGHGFESFVRSLGRQAEHGGLPARSGPPTHHEVQSLAAQATRYGIDLVGPPLQ